MGVKTGLTLLFALLKQSWERDSPSSKSNLIFLHSDLLCSIEHFPFIMTESVLCWILMHVSEITRILSEVKLQRKLKELGLSWTKIFNVHHYKQQSLNATRDWVLVTQRLLSTDVHRSLFNCKYLNISTAITVQNLSLFRCVLSYCCSVAGRFAFHLLSCFSRWYEFNTASVGICTLCCARAPSSIPRKRDSNIRFRCRKFKWNQPLPSTDSLLELRRRKRRYILLYWLNSLFN